MEMLLEAIFDARRSRLCSREWKYMHWRGTVQSVRLGVDWITGAGQES